ncbi:MAG: hypothetical protein RIQ93_1965 [Verrucomicrobiota bacterium]|jgi:hypothetical protein
MNGYGSSDDHQPVTWLRGQPIYAVHLLVLGFVGSMILTTILRFAGGGQVLDSLIFLSTPVLGGEVWRVLTYGLVNDPSLWFVIRMLMLVWFGRELERFFGRMVFLRFYAGLYLFMPLMFTLMGLWRPTLLAGESGGFALFVAFATLYPNVAMIFNILAKWAAAILVGIYTLMALSSRDWVQLASLWVAVGYGYAFVRYEQGHFRLPNFRPAGRSKPKGSFSPDLRPKKAVTVKSAGGNSMVEIDAVLDKIAQSGIGSLTAQERAKLDAAREDLRRKSGRS